MLVHAVNYNERSFDETTTRVYCNGNIEQFREVRTLSPTLYTISTHVTFQSTYVYILASLPTNE